MTYAKEIYLSPNALTCSLDIGNSQTLFEEHDQDCPEDEIKSKTIEKKRIFKLLLGLNKNLDEVQGRILGMKPLPNIWEAFSEVPREESRKKVMMGSQNSTPAIESSALAA